MADQPDTPSLAEVLRRSRPWWILPLLILGLAAAVLVFTDLVPIADLAYSVM